MLRKFRVKINEKEYMVEMEELTTPGLTETQNPPAAAPAAAQTAPPPATPPAAPTPAASPTSTSAANDGEPIVAPMPGTILDVKVKVGDTVSENQVVAILEAMKMENEIVAPKAGTVTAVAVTKGSAIDVGKPIVYLK